jgi:hypothetical protein
MHPECKIPTYYFTCSGGPGAVSIKSAPGLVTPNLSFLHPVGSAGHVVHSGVSEPQNVDVLFFMLAWDRYGFHKKQIGRHYLELVFFNLV